MYAGRKQVAYEACDQLEGFLDEAKLSSHPILPNFFEAYITTRLMVHVRFGEWDAILQTPFKPDKELYRAYLIPTLCKRDCVRRDRRGDKRP